MQKLMDAINRRRFHAHYAKDANAARAIVLGLIQNDQTVGIGGSVTLAKTGIAAAVEEAGKTVYSAAYAVKHGQDMDEARRRALTADVFLSSTNAITQDGVLVNIDGAGNRVAGMIYGPRKVIVVAGKNKLVPTLADAVPRIKRSACPPNARRFHYQTPCAYTGECADCSGPDRMCNVTVVMEYPTHGKEFHVVMIDENYSS